MARRRRNPEIVAGRVNGDGSIAAGEGFTVQRNSAGNYTITFPSSFRLVSLMGSVQGTLIFLDWTPITGNSITIIVNTPAGVGTDALFHFIAAGVQQ